MSVYIAVDGDIYLGQIDNIYCPVQKLEDAKKFSSLTNANSIIKSSVSKTLKKRYKWKVTSIDQLKNLSSCDCDCDRLMEAETAESIVTVMSEDKINNQYTPVDIEELKKSINDLSDKLTTLYGNKEWLLQEESRLDLQINDIMHYIEFQDFNACDGYKLSKILKELRLQRRKVKNELELIKIFSVQTCNNIARGNTINSITGLEDKKYAPRVLGSLFIDKDINALLNKEI